jgi:hypothetical protein
MSTLFSHCSLSDTTSVVSKNSSSHISIGPPGAPPLPHVTAPRRPARLSHAARHGLVLGAWHQHQGTHAQHGGVGECACRIAGDTKAAARVLRRGVVDAGLAATGSAGGRLLLGLLGNSQRDMPQLPLQELRIQLRGVHHVDRGRERREHFEEARDKRHDVRALLHVEQHWELEAQHLFARRKKKKNISQANTCKNKTADTQTHLEQKRAAEPAHYQ